MDFGEDIKSIAPIVGISDPEEIKKQVESEICDENECSLLRADIENMQKDYDNWEDIFNNIRSKIYPDIGLWERGYAILSTLMEGNEVTANVSECGCGLYLKLSHKPANTILVRVEHKKELKCFTLPEAKEWIQKKIGDLNASLKKVENDQLYVDAQRAKIAVIKEILENKEIQLMASRENISQDKQLSSRKTNQDQDNGMEFKHFMAGLARDNEKLGKEKDVILQQLNQLCVLPYYNNKNNSFINDLREEINDLLGKFSTTQKTEKVDSKIDPDIDFPITETYFEEKEDNLVPNITKENEIVEEDSNDKEKDTESKYDINDLIEEINTFKHISLTNNIKTSDTEMESSSNRKDEYTSIRDIAKDREFLSDSRMKIKKLVAPYCSPKGLQIPDRKCDYNSMDSMFKDQCFFDNLRIRISKMIQAETEYSLKHKHISPKILDNNLTIKQIGQNLDSSLAELQSSLLKCEIKSEYEESSELSELKNEEGYEVSSDTYKIIKDIAEYVDRSLEELADLFLANKVKNDDETSELSDFIEEIFQDVDSGKPNSDLQEFVESSGEELENLLTYKDTSEDTYSSDVNVKVEEPENLTYQDTSEPTCSSDIISKVEEPENLLTYQDTSEDTYSSDVNSQVEEPETLLPYQDTSEDTCSSDVNSQVEEPETLLPYQDTSEDTCSSDVNSQVESRLTELEELIPDQISYFELDQFLDDSLEEFMKLLPDEDSEKQEDSNENENECDADKTLVNISSSDELLNNSEDVTPRA